MHISREPIHFTCPVNTIAVLKRFRKSNYVRGCGFALICRFRQIGVVNFQLKLVYEAGNVAYPASAIFLRYNGHVVHRR